MAIELEKIMDNAKFLLKRDGFLAPVIFINSVENQNSIIGLAGMNSINEKETMVMFAGIKAHEEKIKINSVSFVSEAWTVEMKKDEYKEGMQVKPSEHPDRVESIVLASWNLVENKKKVVLQRFKKEGKEIVWINSKHKESESELKEDSRFYILESFVKGYLEPEKSKKIIAESGKNFGWGKSK